MNILFTNHSLGRFGGTEVIIRDLALKFLARGHKLAVYSSRKVAGPSLADVGIPTVHRLAELTFAPDVVHGQHAMDAMTAIIGLPGVPAIYCCHGATRFDAQPRHPRIVLYTAMTASLKIRMAVESNIPEDLITVVPNVVDLDRFRDVRNPPRKPRRALVYNRMASDATRLGKAVKAASEARGIQVDFSRTATGLRTFAAPEEALHEYDIVFASGKSAIDALACGCAVILISGTANGWAPVGLGEMITVENIDRLQVANFTAPHNTSPPEAEHIGVQIDQYDAGRVRAVAELARSRNDMDEQVNLHLRLYQRVLELAPKTVDQDAERRAAHHYLRSLAAWVELGEQRSSEIAAARRGGDDQVPPTRVADRSRLEGQIRRAIAASFG
jgi:hypothetical protein